MFPSSLLSLLSLLSFSLAARRGYHRKIRWPSTTYPSFWLLAAISSPFSHVDVTQHVNKVLETAERSKKKLTLCGRSPAPPSHATFSVSCCVWTTRSDSSNHSLYLMKTIQLQHVRGVDGRSQPLDGSICLSSRDAECNKRFAREYRYEPPLEVLLPIPRCAHQLSGPNTCALTQPTFKITENTHTCCYHESSRTQPHKKKKLCMTVLCVSVLCCVSVLVWKQATAHSTGTPKTPKFESLKIINSRDDKIRIRRFRDNSIQNTFSGATSPIRFLHGALVILVLWQISQFRSFGKWVSTLWLPGTTRLYGTKDGSWEELAGESLGSVTLPFTRFSLNSCSHCGILESNGSLRSFSWSSFFFRFWDFGLG